MVSSPFNQIIRIRQDSIWNGNKDCLFTHHIVCDWPYSFHSMCYAIRVLLFLFNYHQHRQNNIYHSKAFELKRVIGFYVPLAQISLQFSLHSPSLLYRVELYDMSYSECTLRNWFSILCNFIIASFLIASFEAIVNYYLHTLRKKK